MKSAAEIALNNQLRAAFERPELDPSSIQSYFKEAAVSQISLDVATLEFVIRRRLEKEAEQIRSSILTRSKMRINSGNSSTSCYRCHSR